MTNNVLPLDTAIPRAYRSAVRSAVRKASGFEAWCEQEGIENSRDITNPQTIMAAHALGVAQQVADILAGPPPVVMPSVAAPTLPETNAVTDPFTVPAFDVDSVIGDLSVLLSGTMLKGLRDRLSPVVDKANAPVSVFSTGPMTGGNMPAIPHATRGSKSTLGKVMGVTGRYRNVEVQQWNSHNAPARDPYYVVDSALVGEVVMTLEGGAHVWLFGPSGTGKTTLPQQYAAATGREFTRIAFDRTTEIPDLIGTTHVRPVTNEETGMTVSETYWQDAALIAAIRRPGMVILLDEITILPPGTAARLQTILDSKFATLPTGEVVRFAPGVVVVAADNTNGSGDTTGAYHGTNPSNWALVDRFALMVAVDFLPSKMEAEALHKHTGAPVDACMQLTDFASDMRKAAVAQGNAAPLSIRRLIAFVNAIKGGMPMVDAWDRAVLSRLEETDRAALWGAIKAHFDGPRTQAFNQAMNPGAAVVVPTQSDLPYQVEARDTFQEVDV